MKKTIILLLINICLNAVFAQQKNLEQSKWQQTVDYTIDVRLNDKSNSLSGNIKMQYTNNSPDILKEIYIHLWPNAYKNNQTAYAKQDLENGNTDFYFAKKEDRGYIDSIAFTIDNKGCAWQLTKDIDIAKITLSQEIQPNQTVEIATPFYVKIPKVFSRMGHEDQMFCISQWYPKPAVYDVNGWNPMPYLNQGEFYSEYGNFDVSITVPKDYVLAATGDIQNKEELEWLLAKAKKDSLSKEPENPSKTVTKTLRYIQNNVHDFAWFCSKEFQVLHDIVNLSQTKKVDTWLFAKKASKRGIEYTNEAVRFYSEKVGQYPYNLVQVVITPLEAGGGMEYPTITNCGNIDRTTIIHEVGHNWFYGILGSNEREYPWMDESINTYYENRCGEERKVTTDEVKNNQKIYDLFGFNNKGFGMTKLTYAYSSRRNLDQAGNLRSEAYTDNNYGTIVYAKNPLTIQYLQFYLGSDKFDAMMIAYFDKWKFKHPLPGDFRKHAESFTGKSLSWFFDDIMASNKKMDYEMRGIKTKVVEGKTISLLKIKNKGGLNTPFEVQSVSEKGMVLSRNIIRGFSGTQTIELPSQNGALKWTIDGDETSLDLYRQNNIVRTKGLFKTSNGIDIRFLPSLEKSNNTQIFVLPVYGYNFYNKSMLGLYIANDIFPTQKTEFDFVPMYSFTTNDLNGYLKLSRNMFTINNRLIRKVKVGVNASRFASLGLIKDGFKDSLGIKHDLTTSTTYEKFSPFIEIHFKQKTARSLYSNVLIIRHVSILENKQNTSFFSNWNNQAFSALDVKHQFKHDLKTYPSALNIDFQSGTFDYQYNRLSAEFTQGLLYKDGKKTAQIRLFAGTFFNTGNGSTYNNAQLERSYFQAGGTTGNFDYMYDESLIGRAENNPKESIYSRQVINRDAGFRNFANIGSSKTWLTSANITIPFPIKLPIGVYGDVVYFEIPSGYTNSSGTGGGTTYTYYPSKTQLSYSGGLYLSLAKGIFEIYLPLFASTDVQGVWDKQNLNHPFERASFLLNLNKLNPVDLARNFTF
jgi:hypothetical protein